ncbi:hypothetical protein C0J52_25823 [Blattella germanica]|nr:hypothetical protein C0J52_25823 [Blattella germanica]
MNADRKEDTMILWCNFVNCNSQKLEKLTSCPEGRANSRYEGCVILKPGEISPIVSSAINNNNTRIKKILRYIWCAFLFCCILYFYEEMLKIEYSCV